MRPNRMEIRYCYACPGSETLRSKAQYVITLIQLIVLHNQGEEKRGTSLVGQGTDRKAGEAAQQTARMRRQPSGGQGGAPGACQTTPPLARRSPSEFPVPLSPAPLARSLFLPPSAFPMVIRRRTLDSSSEKVRRIRFCLLCSTTHLGPAQPTTQSSPSRLVLLNY